MGASLVLVWRLARDADARFNANTPCGVLGISKPTTNSRVLYAHETKLKQYDVAPETLELLPDAVREFVISNVAGIHNAKESLLHND